MYRIMSRLFYSSSAAAKDNKRKTEQKEYYEAIKKNREVTTQIKNKKTQIVQSAELALEDLVNTYLPIYEKELETVEKTEAEADTENDRKKFLGWYLKPGLKAEDYDKLTNEYKSYYIKPPKHKESVNDWVSGNNPDYILNPEINNYNNNIIPKNFVNNIKRDIAITNLKNKIQILKPISNDFNDNNVTDKFKSYDDYILDKVKVTTMSATDVPTDEEINKKIKYHMNNLFNDDELVKVLLLRKYPKNAIDYQSVASMLTDRGGTRTPKPRSKKHKIQKRPTNRRRHQIKRSRRNKK